MEGQSTQPQMAANEQRSEDPKSTEATIHGNPSSPPKSPKVNTFKRKSPAWDHFTKIKNGDPKKPRASCNYCGATYACDPKNNGTRNLLNHIETQCKKYPYRNEDKKQKTLQLQPTKDGGTGSNLVAVSFTLEGCRKVLAEMIIIDELPFKFVEGQGFRRFMNYTQPKFTNIPCRTTVARDCINLYLEEKKKLKSTLSGQRICITTDTWTSIQNINYMCLTAHFIDKEWNLHKKILNFCQVQSHKGEILGKVVESCLLDWGVDNICTITVDNASSNNGTIQYLKRKTKGWKSTILEHDYLHIRCCAHILNLIVCDGLKELDDSIVKVRNAVRYVKSSPSRLTKFKQCVEKEKIECKGLLCLDVSTRWNSTYMMLESAEKFEKAFERMEDDDDQYSNYFKDEEDDEGDESAIGRGKGKVGRKKLGPPQILDWEKVRIFVKFLKMFYNATMRFSGSLHITSNAFFHELVVIQNKLVQLSKNEDYFLSSMADNMKAKFDKYWKIEKINSLLLVAITLDPRYKLVYVSFWFDRLFETSVAAEMSRKVEEVFHRLYGWYDQRNSKSNASSHKVNKSLEEVRVGDEDDDLDGHAFLASQFKKHLEVEDNLLNKSEVDRYLGERCEEDEASFDVLGWWKINSSKYRVLSLVARDVLAIPVSTVASESAFSTGGRILDPFRSSLLPKTVEALICAQNWLRSSTTLISLRDAMDELEQYEKLDTDLLGSNLSSIQEQE